MPYITDDISQIPDNHSSYGPAPKNHLEGLTLALHKHINVVIDQKGTVLCCCYCLTLSPRDDKQIYYLITL